MVATWFHVVTKFGDINSLWYTVWTAHGCNTTTLGVTTACLVYFGFASWRMLQRNIPFGILLVLVNITAFVGGFGMMVSAKLRSVWSKGLVRLSSFSLPSSSNSI